jgi:hypothetical protein
MWSFGIFFPFWYVWTKKNLATLLVKLVFNSGEFFYQKQRGKSNEPLKSSGDLCT